MSYRSINSVEDLLRGEVAKRELDGSLSAINQEDVFEIIARAREIERENEESIASQNQGVNDTVGKVQEEKDDLSGR